MSNRLPYLVFFGLASIIAVYFLATSVDSTGGSPGSAGREYGDGDAGRSAAADQPNGGGPSGSNGAAVSLFQSDFFKAGETDKPFEKLVKPEQGDEGEPEILDPADKSNPLNPQTGTRYSNSVMKQFEKLREKFPNNSIIPRKKTPEEIEQEKQERLNMYAVKSLIAKGTAAPEDVNKYYDYQAKSFSDRVELLEYIMDKYKTMSPEVKGQYDRILKMNKERLQNLERQRQSSLARIKPNP